MTRDELELLTIDELAELWRVSRRTVERGVASGKIPSVLIGAQRRIRAVDAARIAGSGTSGYGARPSTERTAR